MRSRQSAIHAATARLVFAVPEDQQPGGDIGSHAAVTGPADVGE
jgi:hypothetical protein